MGGRRVLDVWKAQKNGATETQEGIPAAPEGGRRLPSPASAIRPAIFLPVGTMIQLSVFPTVGLAIDLSVGPAVRLPVRLPRYFRSTNG